MPFAKGNTFGKAGKPKGTLNKKPKKKDREYIRNWTLEEFQVLIERNHHKSDADQEKFWFKVAQLPWLFDRPKAKDEPVSDGPIRVTLDLGPAPNQPVINNNTQQPLQIEYKIKEEPIEPVTEDVKEGDINVW